MAMLEVRGVSKSFFPGRPDEVRALRDLDLAIEPGTFVVVVGTNGSGKSTTLNAVAGAFRVDAGTIRLAGRDITRWPEHHRAGLIGRVFQDPLAGTSPGLSIAENLALAARRGLPRGLGRAVSRGRPAEFRERVRPPGMGLEDRIDSPIGGLSGGQRQGLALLMAAYRRPEILLLDEPTAALDPRSAERVIRLTEQVGRRRRLTTMMVTHTMAHAASLGDRLVMVHRGRPILDASGAAKQRLGPPDLPEKFEELRRSDRLDETAAGLLREAHVRRSVP